MSLADTPSGTLVRDSSPTPTLMDGMFPSPIIGTSGLELLLKAAGFTVQNRCRPLGRLCLCVRKTPLCVHCRSELGQRTKAKKCTRIPLYAGFTTPTPPLTPPPPPPP